MQTFQIPFLHLPSEGTKNYDNNVFVRLTLSISISLPRISGLATQLLFPVKGTAKLCTSQSDGNYFSGFSAWRLYEARSVFQM